LGEVELHFPALTILTGPQGSGKSLVCKLIYFCQGMFGEATEAMQQGASLPQFLKSQSARFADWFPASAWGSSKFTIRYETDNFSVEINRGSGRGGVKDYVNVSLGRAFEELYSEYLVAFEEAKRSPKTEEGSVVFYSQRTYRIQNDFEKALLGTFSQSYTSTQVYIPASRAFFTTIGKAMSAFEHGQLLDPITKSFGKLYIALADRLRHGIPMGYRYGTSSSSNTFRTKLMTTIFGGKLRMERNEMIVETNDGRLIPMSALSSGQQEVLPLWFAVDYFDTYTGYSEPNCGANFLYIEEPEAHLFPEAQAGLLRVLVSLLRKPSSRSQMILTTHSPYLLAKANNLLIAGAYGFRKRQVRQKAIEAVVPRSEWLLPGEVACYGLAEGTAVDLLTKSGQISTDYIDEVSQEIVLQHEKLLDIVF
jgi:hypothetical protein